MGFPHKGYFSVLIDEENCLGGSPFAFYVQGHSAICTNTKNPLNYGNLSPQNRIYQGFCGDFFSIILMIFIIRTIRLGVKCVGFPSPPR